MGPTVGALVLFTADLDAAVAFYRLIGIALEVDDHGDDDAPVHYAAELGDCHFAIFPAEESGRAPRIRQAGAAFPGFAVESVEAKVAALRAAGHRVMQELSAYPWGLRAVVEDPDGRPVEVYTPPG